MPQRAAARARQAPATSRRTAPELDEAAACERDGTPVGRAGFGSSDTGAPIRVGCRVALACVATLGRDDPLGVDRIFFHSKIIWCCACRRSMALFEHMSECLTTSPVDVSSL